MRTFMDIAGDDSTEDKMKSQGLSFDPSYFKAKKEVFVQQKMHTSYADSEEGQGPDPPEKSQKYRVSLHFWSGSPEESQSY